MDKVLVETIFVNSPFGVARISKEGKMTEVNPKFAEMLGVNFYQLVGLNFAEVFNPGKESRSTPELVN